MNEDKKNTIVLILVVGLIGLGLFFLGCICKVKRENEKFMAKSWPKEINIVINIDYGDPAGWAEYMNPDYRAVSIRYLNTTSNFLDGSKSTYEVKMIKK